jgi:NitT/TauT family transport system ATP-binding protein
MGTVATLGVRVTPPPASEAGLDLVHVDRVRIQYAAASGRPVIADVSLRARAGEFICLIGPSGCGKSTLLKAIAGFVPIAAGRIMTNGAPIAGPDSDRGMVFQEFALFPWLTVEQNVLFGDHAAQGGARARRERAQHYLALVGLSAYGGYYPAQLSGGMKQRVALARAWANRPSVLLMDEPFGALDARTRQELQETILRIFETERTLCFFVTHDTLEAVYLADRVVVMSSRGEIREEIRVALPRPRDRHGRDLVALVKDVDRLAWEAKE